MQTELLNKTNTVLNELQFKLVHDLSGGDVKKIYKKLMKSGLDQKTRGFWIWDVMSGEELYSPMFRASIGYKGEKDFPSVPQSWMDAIDPDDLKVAMDNFDEHVASGGDAAYIQNVRYNKKHGGQVEVQCHGKVLSWSAEGLPLVMVGVHMNVSGLYESF